MVLIFSTPKLAGKRVELREQPVQILDHRCRCDPCRVLGEAHQIGEQNAHALEAVGDHGFALVQAANHLSWQDGQQQPLELGGLVLDAAKIPLLAVTPALLVSSKH